MAGKYSELTLHSWNRQPPAPAPRPPPPPRRVSGRLKVPIYPKPPVWIDLTERTTDGCGGKVNGKNPAIPAVKLSTIAKEKGTGKRMVHSIEKWIQIMDSKMKKKRPEWKH
jgi:hypothetical protein